MSVQKKRLQDGENGEDSANGEDRRVGVIEVATGRTLTGDDAPLMSQLAAFLESHPGWEAIDSDSEDDDDEEEENEEKANGKYGQTKNYKQFFSTSSLLSTAEGEKASSEMEEEKAKKTLHKAKVEDDEYKTEEQTYYSIAHTVHESVTEQASIMVNGKLKEYQIKVRFHP